MQNQGQTVELMTSLGHAASFAAALSLACSLLAAEPPNAPPPAGSGFACPVLHNEYHADGPPRAPRQDYEPKPAMWKLSDKDTTIHVFGTFHVLPEGFRWRTATFDKVMAEAKEVVFESRDEEPSGEDGAVSAEEQRYIDMIASHSGTVPLSQRISEGNRAKLKRLFRLAGILPSDMELVPPVVAMFTIDAINSEAEGSLEAFGVETVIEKEFRGSGRPVSAIEDPVAVMESLLALDESQIAAMIDAGLDNWDGCTLADPYEIDWSMQQNWARGEVAAADIKAMDDNPFEKAFYEAIIVNRNRAWADWLTARMKQPGNLLLAVGAAHMEGPDSVLLMLEKRGIKAEQVQ